MSSTVKRDLRTVTLLWILPLSFLVVQAVLVIPVLLSEMDVGLWDETHYLYNGLLIPEFGLRDTAYGPSYQLWYLLLSHLQPLPLPLYYYNYALTCSLPILGYFSLLMISTKRPVAAFVLAAVYLVSGANLSMWPRVGSFVLLVVCVGLAVSRSCNSNLFRFLVLLLTVTIAAYARPEYFVSLAILVGWIVYRGAHYLLRLLERGARARITALAIACLASGGVFFATIDSRRGSIAIQQHFARNYIDWSDLALNPYADAPKIIHELFGEQEIGLWGMIIKRPDLMLKHFLYNVYGIGAELPTFMIPKPDRLAGMGDLQWILIQAILIIAVLLTKTKHWVLQDKKKGRPYLVCLVLFVFPGILSAIVIYPNTGYLTVPILMLAYLLCQLERLPLIMKCSAHTLVAILLIVGTLTSLNAYGARAVAERYVPFWLREKTNLRIIHELAQLKLEKGLRYLSMEGSFHVYVDQAGESLFVQDIESSLSEHLMLGDIDVIIVTAELRRNYRYREDLSWRSLEADPQGYGYRCVKVPESTAALYIKSTALTPYTINTDAQ